MIRFYPDETFKEINLEGDLKFRYTLSNYGHLVRFSEDIKDGELVKVPLIDGYQVFQHRYKEDGKTMRKNYFLYKLVAELFIPKTDEKQVHVLHLDRIRNNDKYTNLKWATYEEKQEFVKKSPFVIEAKRKLIEHNIKSNGRKLTETKVMFLKKILLDPNNKTKRRLLAKQFGVSEMQLHRIKTGENWGHIKVEIRSINEKKEE
jgi:hypothetical protein